MKRGAKLIILFAVLVVLAGAYALITKLTDEDEAPGDETALTILGIAPDAVSLLSLQNEKWEGTLTGGEKWTLEKDETFPVDQQKVWSMLDKLVSVSASRVLGAPEDLSQYGLENPSNTVTVIMADGSSKILRFGNQNKLTEEYYLRVGDGAQVYLVSESLYDAFDLAQESLLKYEELPVLGQVTSCTIRKGDRSTELKYFEDNTGLSYSPYYNWFVHEEDSFTELDTEAVSAYTDLAAKIEWESCADWNASEEELAAYGLDEPSVLYLEGSDGSFALEIGASGPDGYYARLAGSKMVYVIDAKNARTLVEADIEAMLPSDVCLMDWSTVRELLFALDGQTHSLQFVYEASSEGQDGQAVSYNVDGAPADIQSVQSVINMIDSMESSGTTNVGSSSEPELELRFIRSAETFKEVTLSFSPYDVSDAAVTLNGTSRLLVTKESVAQLKRLLSALMT